MNKEIITRFAPSPTGELHIGGARTALFAYLFAKHNSGKFFLRIEDTDQARSVEGADERIVESLKWLGIKADNESEIVYQSKRLDKYRKFAFQLVNEGKAYICSCTEEEIKAQREKDQKEGRPPRYSGKCREAGIKAHEVAEGEYVVRMKMPKSGTIKVNDLIRGEVEFEAGLIDDQIILKSDGFPTYHLASVIDDHDMEVSHVIRAEEWLPSTPKHLVLYEMFGWTPPEFAHLSMILGPDKAKLSKRHGATSVLDYRELGYLPEAVVNFMALLGWNPKDEREIFSIEELAAEFKLENVNKAAAVFDLEKLNWINGQYLQSKVQSLKSKGEQTQFLKEFGIDQLSEGENSLVGRGGFKTLKEAADYILKLRELPYYKPELLVFKKSTKETSLKGLTEAHKKLAKIEKWVEEQLQEELSKVVAEQELTNGDVFWPVRVSLSGDDKSPSPVELLVALGKVESIKRIERGIRELS
jgi:glutamyl-tRNA synthetase